MTLMPPKSRNPYWCWFLVWGIPFKKRCPTGAPLPHQKGGISHPVISSDAPRFFRQKR